MGIGLQRNDQICEIGSSEFLDAFFSTITTRLEPLGWGTRFPILLNEFYQGTLSAHSLSGALAELKLAKAELKQLPPSKVIWNRDDLSQRPPWGDVIASHITDLSNYFVTSDGNDLFQVLEDSFEAALTSNEPIQIVPY